LKRKIIIGVVIVALLVGIVSPWIYMWQKDRTTKQTTIEQSIQSGFLSKYGNTSTLMNVTKPENIYLVSWKDNEYGHISLWIDGVWAEVYRVSLTAPTPTPTPTPVP